MAASLPALGQSSVCSILSLISIYKNERLSLFLLFFLISLISLILRKVRKTQKSRSIPRAYANNSEHWARKTFPPRRIFFLSQCALCLPAALAVGSAYRLCSEKIFSVNASALSCMAVWLPVCAEVARFKHRLLQKQSVCLCSLACFCIE